MVDSVLAEIAGLSTKPTADLKARWRELFESEPPPYNRKFLVSRLAYRIQELAYGGLKVSTVERLDALADQVSGTGKRKYQVADRPPRGTQLIRVWQGVEHVVSVRDDDFEYQGRPFKSLSAVARAITGTQWNGLIFFGLKSARSAE